MFRNTRLRSDRHLHVQGGARLRSADTHEALLRRVLSPSASSAQRAPRGAASAAGSLRRSRSTSATPHADGAAAATEPQTSTRTVRELTALVTELRALPERLPVAVSGDARSQPLKEALQELRAVLASDGDAALGASPAAQAAALAAARAALAVVTEALASFASDLRTAHLCRVDAESARAAAEAAAGDAQQAANTYRAKRDEAGRYGQEKAEQLRKERAVSAELKKQLQHFSTVLTAATDHVENMHGGVTPSVSGRSSRVGSHAGRR